MSDQVQNDTSEAEFLIVAFPASSVERSVLFSAISLAYSLVICGNLLILILANVASHLHMPMYFFLCNLSLLDILYVSTIIPKLLYILYTDDYKASFGACIFQLFLFIFFGDTESFLLTAIAFDRYVAICTPLHYSCIMNKNICVVLAAFAWLMGAVNSSILTPLISSLTFNNINEINNFFCDDKALIYASSSDTANMRKLIASDIFAIAGIPLFLILTSYICIIINVLKMHSSSGRRKTFSNCSSHLTIVALYYGPPLFIYTQSSQEQDKILSVIFVTLVPMLNPVVYTLRNKDIMKAIKALMNRAGRVRCKSSTLRRIGPFLLTIEVFPVKGPVNRNAVIFSPNDHRQNQGSVQCQNISGKHGLGNFCENHLLPGCTARSNSQ